MQTLKIMPNVSFAHIYTLFQIQIRHKYVQTFLCQQITRFAHIKTLFHSFFKMRLGCANAFDIICTSFAQF